MLSKSLNNLCAPSALTWIPDILEREKEILLRVLDSAEQQDFSGYSKFDALNSPLLLRLSFNRKWLRFFFVQAVKESPIHVRPLLGVKKSRNPKGIALFARAYFFLYQGTEDEKYLKKGENLSQWLLKHPSRGMKNLCWGYNFIWQSTLFTQERFKPNLVVSVFVGETLVHAFRLTRKETYLDAARSIGGFILEELPILHRSENELAVSYVPTRAKAIVLNNQVLAGAFLAKLWKETKEDSLREAALRLITFTVNRRTPYNAWYYTFPKDRSPISHDNYHTGGILDGLLEYYEETGDNRFMEAYWSALSYYADYLFEKNGAPRWMNNKEYPHDVHGAAQGIISFKKAGRYHSMYQDKAKDITNWAINHLYRKSKKDFLYREGRWMKWNYSLMRWCNAWMARALAE